MQRKSKTPSRHDVRSFIVAKAGQTKLHNEKSLAAILPGNEKTHLRSGSMAPLCEDSAAKVTQRARDDLFPFRDQSALYQSPSSRISSHTTTSGTRYEHASHTEIAASMAGHSCAKLRTSMSMPGHSTVDQQTGLRDTRHAYVAKQHHSRSSRIISWKRHAFCSRVGGAARRSAVCVGLCIQRTSRTVCSLPKDGHLSKESHRRRRGRWSRGHERRFGGCAEWSDCHSHRQGEKVRCEFDESLVIIIQRSLLLLSCCVYFLPSEGCISYICFSPPSSD